MGFNISFNGQNVDLSDPQALADAGITVGGDIVLGDQHLISGGTHDGDIYVGDQVVEIHHDR